MLRNIITEVIKDDYEKTDNFQDLSIWKVLVVQIAKSLQMKYERTLIVPMTICNKEYFRYIYDGFREFDSQTYHFCLMANEETIYRRLRQRGETEGNWCFQQTKKCINAFKDSCFQEYVWTEDIDIDDIVGVIENRINNN